jgi:hypothetical protein
VISCINEVVRSTLGEFIPIAYNADVTFDDFKQIIRNSANNMALPVIDNIGLVAHGMLLNENNYSQIINSEDIINGNRFVVVARLHAGGKRKSKKPTKKATKKSTKKAQSGGKRRGSKAKKGSVSKAKKSVVKKKK